MSTDSHEPNGMNKYVVKQIIGEGAYGVVMKCRHKLTNDMVAIKKFKDSEDDSDARRTISRELSMLQKLKHRNIVSLRETFRRKGKLYMVFDFVERNILQLLEENPNGIDTSLVRSYTYQLVTAVLWCHENDVIHRDIKPENLLISSANVLKLCDFGFARNIMTSSAAYTDYVATRWYRAPELLLGGSYGPAIDIWSTGCIMGELADGKPVFPGESEIDQLYVIQKVLGPLPDDLMDLFSTSPRFSGLKFPPIQQPSECLDDRYASKLDCEMLDFLKRVLNMSASQRPSAGMCREHAAFRDLNLVDLPRSDTGEKSAAKDAMSTEKNLSVSEQHSLNGGLLTSDSTYLVADRKHRGSNRDTEIVNPTVGVCEEQASDYRYAQRQSHIEPDQVVEVSAVGGETSVDVRVLLRCRQAIQDTGGGVDENTSCRAAVPLKKMKGKKSIQSGDLTSPVFADFSHFIGDRTSVRSSDRRALDCDTAATMSSFPMHPLWGSNCMTSLQDGTKDDTSGTVTVAVRESDMVAQSLLPTPRTKYCQPKSPGMALRSGANLMLKNHSASLPTADFTQNKAVSHAVSPLIQRRGSDTVTNANPLPAVAESEQAVGDLGRHWKTMGQSYIRGPVMSTVGLAKEFGNAAVNLNQSYPPPQLNLEKRRRHRNKAHSEGGISSLRAKSAITRLPSDLSPTSCLSSNPHDHKLLNCQDLTSPTSARRIPPLVAGGGCPSVLPPGPILKRLETKPQDCEPRQEFALPDTVFENPGEKIRLKPLRMPLSGTDKTQRRVQLEQLHSRTQMKALDDEGVFPPSLSGQPHTDDS